MRGDLNLCISARVYACLVYCSFAIHSKQVTNPHGHHGDTGILCRLFVKLYLYSICMHLLFRGNSYDTVSFYNG